MEGILIIGIIFIVLGIVATVNDHTFFTWLFTFIGAYCLSAYLWECSESNDLRKPRAIDVYRGNTTLEITYRDSIPVDTVVVFKKK